METTGVLVAGRHLFDITNGWGDHHPAAPRVVVVTHQPPADAQKWPNTSFVSGVEGAVSKAKEIAGDKDVVIASANIIQQALAPVLFGEGIPYFSKLKKGHQLLEDPVIVQGRRALHLRYPVRR